MTNNDKKDTVTKIKQKIKKLKHKVKNINKEIDLLEGIQIDIQNSLYKDNN